MKNSHNFLNLCNESKIRMIKMDRFINKYERNQLLSWNIEK